jgi:hypothetical protein
MTTDPITSSTFIMPMVRGEVVEILGPKPEDFTGLGHLNGDVLVRYLDGEIGAVGAEDIIEGALA